MLHRRLILVVVIVLVTAVLSAVSGPWRSLWPSVVALLVIVATRRALVGLLTGGYMGAVLLAGGDPWQGYLAVFGEHLAPSLTSPWRLGAVAFTLVLGGFAAVLDAGGGFASLLRRLSPGDSGAARRFELSAMALGLLCFFDGLANSMMVGRVGRRLADRCGTARVKLAYIVDSTSSAVACVALVSTWIAFQLSMIEEGYRLAGVDVNPYAAFLQSLPYNFHCWFTLILLPAAIIWRFAPGPMGGFEGRRPAATASDIRESPTTGGSAAALVPMAVLLTAFVLGFMVLGRTGAWWPPSRASLVAAFGSDAGPLVMVLAGAVATITAALWLPGRPMARLDLGARAFTRGMQAMMAPVFILLAAWILGSVVQALGTADLIAGLVDRAGTPALVPLVTFITGALVSFATGTSWGTMGLLFPLALPAAGDPALMPATVAAVFSGAVFGDHCSPFSDTTIVTAIACEIEPHDHVRTQMPYALIAATAAAVVGFLPAGFGVWPGWSLLAGGVGLVLLARRGRIRYRVRSR